MQLGAELGDPVEIIAAGELALPLSALQPLQQVAVADLGGLVVALLNRREEFLGQRVEVAGDQPRPQQMAHALAIASGKPIEYRQRDLEDVAARSTDIAAMYRYLDQIGYQVDIPNLRNRFPEVSWTSFADWARQQVTPH